jgi:putative addiction module component (TIGR02574 family)
MAARDLLAEALTLPPAERGRIVRELISSLDQNEAEDPAEVERAWAAELEARATRALRGESTARDLDLVCDEIESGRRPAK